MELEPEEREAQNCCITAPILHHDNALARLVCPVLTIACEQTIVTRMPARPVMPPCASIELEEEGLTTCFRCDLLHAFIVSNGLM
jgi:hypothetical protein